MSETEDFETQNIRQRTVTGLGWTATSRMSVQVLQFGFTVILARILLPSDFGLIAMVSVFVGFCNLFIDFGLTNALVQRANLEGRHLISAFWLSLAIGAVLTLVIIALAPALAALYSVPEVLWLTIAIAPTLLLGSLAGVQTALIFRAMDFRTYAVIENGALVASGAVAMGLALAGLGVWSLVVFTVAGYTARTILLWVFNSWRPRGRPDRRSIHELWGFSSRLTGFNAVNYWARNADNLLVGAFLGATQLGYYSRAYNLMLLPLDTTSSVTTPVMNSALARLQDDHDRLKRVYLRALGMIAIVMFPAIVGLFVVCRPFILTVYGPKWEPVVPILQILCIAALVQTLCRTTGWIFTALGRTDWLFRWGLVGGVTAICSFFIGLPWGLHGIAVSYACWSILVTYPLFALVGRLIDMSTMELVRSVAGVSVASAGMGVCVWATEATLLADASSLVQLTGGMAVGVVTYLIVLHLVSPEAYHEARRLLTDYRRRWRGRTLETTPVS
jgi:PST family polysaccharide transporter